MDTKRMRACVELLPPPGDAVLVECLNEIDRLQGKISKLTDIAEEAEGYLNAKRVLEILGA